MPIYGDKPQVNRGFESDYRQLFYSQSDIALILNKTVQAGYGLLPTGTVMAEPTVSGELVPYPMVAFSGEDFTDSKHAAYMPLVLDGTSDDWIYVSNADARKVRVGQSLALAYYNSDYVYVDLGAVTGITFDSGVNGRAKIAVTNDPTTGATVARQAAAYVKTDTSSPYAKAKFILDKGIDTGVGSNALGALTSVVMSNAVLYKGSMPNYDSAAKTDLSAEETGQFVILK